MATSRSVTYTVLEPRANYTRIWFYMDSGALSCGCSITRTDGAMDSIQAAASAVLTAGEITTLTTLLGKIQAAAIAGLGYTG